MDYSNILLTMYKKKKEQIRTKMKIHKVKKIYYSTEKSLYIFLVFFFLKKEKTKLLFI